MSAQEDQQEQEELESERDFLMQSLDDLELEHESGGIDDESYEALRDDYTARAAATIRALRDGVDARPAKAPAPPAKRRIAVIALVVVFAIGAGVALAAAVGVRLPGETSSGNTSSDAATIGRQITSLQKQVNASPDDYDLRLELADAYARNNDLPTAIEQWDAAITIDPNRPEGHAQVGRALYLVSQQVKDKSTQAQLVAQARAAFDKAIEVGPDYHDSYFFRGVLLAAIGELAASQADLQTYLASTPSGTWSESARSALAEVTNELANPSTTVPTTP
ncbi:MAG TPA: tetratricopeptide repeat protein [Acidimicrobiia bacterium]|nr:tetratricopeptide repeat protein [Acidimicrobiia bacterium]